MLALDDVPPLVFEDDLRRALALMNEERNQRIVA